MSPGRDPVAGYGTTENAKIMRKHLSQHIAPNLTIKGLDGTSYAYRRFGKADTVPVVFLQHFRGNPDSWDPALIDDMAGEREVILADNSGVGLSTGTTPHTVKGLAHDILAFVDTLGLTYFHLFGFSLGGFVAQETVLLRPYLVRRLILAGTGPEGGRNMHIWSEEVRSHAFKDVQGADDVFTSSSPQPRPARPKGRSSSGGSSPANRTATRSRRWPSATRRRKRSLTGASPT